MHISIYMRAAVTELLNPLPLCWKCESRHRFNSEPGMSARSAGSSSLHNLFKYAVLIS